MEVLQSFAQIGFDWRIAVANVINFVIVFVVLKYFVFQPIKQTLSERQAKIQKGLEDAKKADSKLAMAEQKYEEKVQEAKQEANEILQDAQEKKESIIQQAKVDAKDEAAAIKEEAREEMEREREKMEARLREHTAELVIDSVEKILEKRVGDADDKEIIENMINRVRS